MPRARENTCLSSSRQAQGKSNISLPFCSTWAFSGLGDTHLQWGGPPSILSLSVQILIFSRRILSDIPTNNV